jgi:hypothetical protein
MSDGLALIIIFGIIAFVIYITKPNTKFLTVVDLYRTINEKEIPPYGFVSSDIIQTEPIWSTTKLSVKKSFVRPKRIRIPKYIRKNTKENIK